MELPMARAAGWALLLLLARPGFAQTFTKNPPAASAVFADTSTNYQGVAWVDIDGDGNLDLYINNNFLYRGDGLGGFTKLATAIGNGVTLATGDGTSWGDFDNDGDIDCYLVCATGILYRNNGSGVFSAVTSGVIAQFTANRGWAAAWGDLDNDGDLDLAVTHPAGFVPGSPTTNHVYLNNGPPNYTFTRVTTGPIVTGLSSYTVGTWSDYDQDGDLDYFIGAGPANGTTQPDFLYRNLLKETGAASFERITDSPIATDQQDGQVWNWIDYDNDGDFDAYVTNWGGAAGGTGLPNRLYRNDGGAFTAITTGAIVTDADISLASVWGDFDNDGDLDCYVTNDAGQTDRYYSNNGDGTFTSLTNALTETVTHRGAAAGDYDNDGDLDLYADGPNGNRALFRNDTANGNHWLELRLAGVISNRSAIGAKVRACAVIGGHNVCQLREVSAQNSFNSQNSLVVHFGLGDGAIVDRLTVEWPSGLVQTLRSVAANQRLVVTEATPVPGVPSGAGTPGLPLLASRSGSDVLVSWDAATCPAVRVNLYQGALGNFASFTGGTCDLPATGTATVPMPDGAWFVVAATDGVSTDGSYGQRSTGAERDVAGASAACPAITQHVVSNTCP